MTTDFGTDGDFATAVRVQGDGKIVVAGFHYSGTSDSEFAVARYNANGSPDTDFNGTGKVTTPIGAGNGGSVGVTVLGDGRIIVAGSIFGPGGANGYRVARYKSDGSLDDSFDFDGLVQTPVGSSDNVTAVAIQPGNGSWLGSNDNWRSDEQAAISATGIPPPNDLEAAIVTTLPPAAYTAIVSGVEGGSGVGLVEVYALD